MALQQLDFFFLKKFLGNYFLCEGKDHAASWCASDNQLLPGEDDRQTLSDSDQGSQCG